MRNSNINPVVEPKSKSLHRFFSFIVSQPICFQSTFSLPPEIIRKPLRFSDAFRGSRNGGLGTDGLMKMSSL